MQCQVGWHQFVVLDSFYPLTLHIKNDIFGFANVKRHFVSNEPVREFSEFVLDTSDE